MQICKLFVGGLSFDTDDDKLRAYFERFGVVNDAIVMRDWTTRRSRGFGFVTFSDSSEADAAMYETSHVVDGRRVETKRAVPKGEVRSTSHSDRQQVLKAQLAQQQQLQMQIEQMQRRMQLQMEQMALSGAAPPLLAEQVAALGGAPEGDDTYDAPARGPAPAPLPTSSPSPRENRIRKIFVGGLHYDTGEKELTSYFSTFGEIEEVQVMYNRETNKSRGFGFVTFKTADSANQVLQDRMHIIDRKSVEVKLAVPKSEVGGCGRRLAPRPLPLSRDGSGGGSRWRGQQQSGQTRRSQAQSRSQGQQPRPQAQRQVVAAPRANAWHTAPQGALAPKADTASQAPAGNNAWNPYRQHDDQPAVDMSSAWEEDVAPVSPVAPVVAVPPGGFSNNPHAGPMSGAPAWSTSQAPAASQANTWGATSSSFMSFFPTTSANPSHQVPHPDAGGGGGGGVLYGNLASQRVSMPSGPDGVSNMGDASGPTAADVQGRN
jgi:RNA recognition motif-containing protein